MRAAAGPWHRPSCPGNEAGTRHSREQCHGTGLIQPSTSFPPGLSAACTKEGTPVCVQELLVFSPHRAAGQEQPLRTQHGCAHHHSSSAWKYHRCYRNSYNILFFYCKKYCYHSFLQHHCQPRYVIVYFLKFYYQLFHFNNIHIFSSVAYSPKPICDFLIP